MPRIKQHTTEELLNRAMHQFWRFGYELTSMSDLVAATGVNRHSIYASYGNKKELFLACLQTYQEIVVSPAFAQVESADANLASIASYFRFQIRRAEQSGLPGPGCLVANTMTECGPHDSEIEKAVARHNERLTNGFQNALKNEFALSKTQLRKTANFLCISAQGLWSVSRTVSQAKELHEFTNTLIDLIKTKAQT